MDFNRHSELADRHAVLSPSYYHWINYTDDKLESRFISMSAARRGSEIHDFAHKAIELGMKLSKGESALARYVADGIGYKMRVEQPLYYSENCFGHADTLSFRRNKLRIHDLKTGANKASVHQLEIYAALFCLEYVIDPHGIEIELRIYQQTEVSIWEGDPNTIAVIMEKIIDFDMKLEMMKERML